MPRYSDEVISDIIAANDLAEVAGRYVQLKRNGRDYMGLCPFHKEKTPSFHISTDKQLYHCFGCGAGGSVIQFVMNIENLDFTDAVKSLADRAGIRLPDEAAPDDKTHARREKMYEMNKCAARFFRDSLFSDAGAPAREYLRRRGLNSQTVARFGIGFALPQWSALCDHLMKNGFDKSLIAEVGLGVINEKNHIYDRFRGRVIFPIIDVRGHVAGFTARLFAELANVNNPNSKYTNSPASLAYDKSTVIYGLNLAKNAGEDSLILVEGQMDVITLHQSGITNAVAGSGTAFTDAQVRLLLKYAHSIYLCYDADEAGQKACERAIAAFSGKDCRLRVITVPDGKDPDEFVRKYGGEEFKKLISSARTVTEYRLFVLEKKYDLDNMESRIEYANAAAGVLAGVSNSIEREMHIKALAQKTGVPESAVISEVAKQKTRARRAEERSAIADASRPRTERAILDAQSAPRAVKAERSLLALLIDMPDTLKKISGEISENDFSLPFHREVFAEITRLDSLGKTIDAQTLTAAFPAREGELSAIVVNAPPCGEPKSAALDYIFTIKDEQLRARIAAAEKSGDIRTLDMLIKERMMLDGNQKKRKNS